MLQELSIRNFAIIDDLNIRFSKGLTILSGETGAGKSILINAVNLLLGSRASSTLIRTGCETAELEALFEIAPESRIGQLMAQHGYDPAEGLLIRRLISHSENNRIYINGRLATMQVLNAVTENLASISGQHAHQHLLREDQHLLILDQFGGLLPLRQAVRDEYHQLVPLIRELEKLHEMKHRQAEQVELMRFQRDEILEADVEPDEDQQREQERSRLKNSEFLYQTVFDGIENLYGSQGSIFERLAEIKHGLDRGARIDTGLEPLANQLADISYRLEDLVGELRDYLNQVVFDPSRLEIVEERLDVINKLKRKYGGSLDAVRNHLDSTIQALSKIENIDAEIQTAEDALDRRHRQLAESALKLSEKRQKAAEKLSAAVESQLQDLKMGQTRFEVDLRVPAADPQTSPYLTFEGKLMTETGFDRASFRIAPNVGEALKALAAIASGGELSRIILAIKAILAATDSVETVVFDEVDAGIGGGTAEVVGRKLAELAQTHQVVCITHLPQIARFGDSHFRIAKQVRNGRTQTHMTPLTKAERIEEIARMLGGVEITPTTRAHAEEMLKE
jgi:DNA repair protein RecN (Recombination protein N)